jgi:hypothetical protein
LATIDKDNCELSGDIAAIKEEGRFFTEIFSVELKTGYPKTNFHQHLQKSCKSFAIADFWFQACCAADKSKKLPMLIYRKKGMNTIVGISKETSEKLVDFDELRSITLYNPEALYTLVLYNFEHFFTLISPDLIKGKLCRR